MASNDGNVVPQQGGHFLTTSESEAPPGQSIITEETTQLSPNYPRSDSADYVPEIFEYVNFEEVNDGLSTLPGSWGFIHPPISTGRSAQSLLSGQCYPLGPTTTATQQTPESLVWGMPWKNVHATSPESNWMTTADTSPATYPTPATYTTTYPTPTTYTSHATYQTPTTLSPWMDEEGGVSVLAVDDASIVFDFEPAQSGQIQGPSSRQGIAPGCRTSEEVPTSVIEMAAMREVQERNEEVDRWIAATVEEGGGKLPPPLGLPELLPMPTVGDLPGEEIPFGHRTLNNPVPGQIYYQKQGGELTEVDLRLIHQQRNWADAPLLLEITDARYQPESSNAAMATFNRMCDDNKSVGSTKASWGTRRMSLPSFEDIDNFSRRGSISGNFLKRMGREHWRPYVPKLVRELPKLVRKRRDAVQSRMGSLLDGSRPPLSRIQSGCSSGLSHSHLASLEKRHSEASASPVEVSDSSPFEQQDLDDESESESDSDSDSGEDGLDVSLPTRIAMANTTPSIADFKRHIVYLNPGMAVNSSRLVDRIAHQQFLRYRRLLKFQLDRRDRRSVKIKTEKGVSVDERQAISPTSLPFDMSRPPFTSLPAQFECPLCFRMTTVRSVSEWKRHVHEDVLPFVCTWESCKDRKEYKRKADWVRHENERHRQLDWWTCDVGDCGHKCFRRDIFVQHLVREHKHPEPKPRTKASLNRVIGSSSGHPTWSIVERCHSRTKQQADEPCRFCGKRFDTWKKLTSHLARHMEQISLPTIQLVFENIGEGSFPLAGIKQEPTELPVSSAKLKPEPPDDDLVLDMTKIPPFPQANEAILSKSTTKAVVPVSGSSITMIDLLSSPSPSPPPPEDSCPSQPRPTLQPGDFDLSSAGLNPETENPPPSTRSFGTQTLLPTPRATPGPTVDLAAQDNNISRRSPLHDSSCESTADQGLETTRIPKQVGVARVRIELLTISSRSVANDADDCASQHSSADSCEDQDGIKDCNFDNEDEIAPVSQSGREANPLDAQAAGPSSSNPITDQCSTQRKSRDDDDDRRDQPRKRRRQGPRAPCSKINSLRFACPYQKYHMTRESFISQECLRQGPRNRQGGCEGIVRLK